MKKAIITAGIAACLALCAAMWPQAEPVEETPASNQKPAATAPLAAVLEPEPAAIAEPAVVTEPEKESTESTPTETTDPTTSELVYDTAPAVEQESEQPAPEQEYEPEAEITPEPPDPEPSAEQNGDMVYVPGFGWLENQGPNHVEYAEDIYENGNKIGSMG